MPRKTIESIDSSKEKSSVPKIFEQITFVVRNPYGQDIVKKKTKNKNKEKRKQSLQNSILENILSCYNLFYSDFVSRKRASMHSAWTYSGSSYSRLQSYIARPILPQIHNCICNEVEPALV